MIYFIKHGKADAILCWKLDRLARNPADEGLVKWMLQQGIIKQIKTNDRDYKPDDNVLLSSVEFGMANQYILDLSKNVMRGQRTKLEKGGWPNMAPLGYKNENSTLVLDKERAKYIKRAFELYATGSHSLKEVADILFKEGFRSRAGKKYHKSRIHKLLSRSFYYGVMYMRGIYYPGNHETIISKDLFDKVQDVINGKNRSRYKKHFYPLRGFMTCNVCGCLITAFKQKGFVYYYCTNGKGKCEQHKHYLKKEKAETLLASIFPKIKLDPEFIELCYEAEKYKNQKDENFFENVKSNLEKRLKSLREQELKLLDVQLCWKVHQGSHRSEVRDAQQRISRRETATPET